MASENETVAEIVRELRDWNKHSFLDDYDHERLVKKNPAHYIAMMQSLRQMAKYTGQTSAQTACHCSLESSTFSDGNYHTKKKKRIQAG